jgi:hypothetical protein
VSWQEFQTNYLEKGLVRKIVIANKSIARSVRHCPLFSSHLPLLSFPFSSNLLGWNFIHQHLLGTVKSLHSLRQMNTNKMNRTLQIIRMKHNMSNTLPLLFLVGKNLTLKNFISRSGLLPLVPSFFPHSLSLSLVQLCRFL